MDIVQDFERPSVKAHLPEEFTEMALGSDAEKLTEQRLAVLADEEDPHSGGFRLETWWYLSTPKEVKEVA